MVEKKGMKLKRKEELMADNTSKKMQNNTL
jgi:hypothetical protein